ncbi:MAG TPA: hypothetical protein VGI45_24845 [Terracidiphilus sp.]|jgi:hypothetical protein
MATLAGVVIMDASPLTNCVTAIANIGKAIDDLMNTLAGDPKYTADLAKGQPVFMKIRK